MHKGSKELVAKIQNLITTTPDWFNFESMDVARTWLAEVYMVVELSGASKELLDLQREMDSLTECLANPGSSTEATKKFANKISNILARALATTQAEVQRLSQYRPINIYF